MSQVEGGPDEVRRLQTELEERLAAVSLLPESDPGYGAACDRVFEVGHRLVQAESHLRRQAELGPHRVTTLILRGSGAFTALVGLGLAVAAAAGGRSFGWMVAAAAALGAGGLVFLTQVHPPKGPHRRQRPGAIAVAAGAVLLLGVLLATPDKQPMIWWLAAAAAAASLGLIALRAVPVAPETLDLRTHHPEAHHDRTAPLDIR
ncbi:hypothetical protein ACIB24_03430 [Spongisporangium articulatum]|uniref:DUF2157 domain-containing protein n=1 Tax=Spongisporangium articulatum TaxID=3362603 RepID=A0ABW8AIC5_9ACTN